MDVIVPTRDRPTQLAACLAAQSIAYTVCGSAGLDVSGYAIRYLASWSEQAPLETVHACAAMIDRYARRLEAVIEASLRGETAVLAV
jgi:hypothetical protein